MKKCAGRWALLLTALLLAFVAGAQSRAAEMVPSARELSIADGRKAGQSDDDSFPAATDDDDDVASTGAASKKSSTSGTGTGSDETSSSTTSTGTTSSTGTSSASTTTSSATEPPAATKPPAPSAPSTSANATSSSRHHHRSSGNATISSNSTSSTNASSTDSTENSAGGVSEWTFHNETALEDAKYNLSLANTTTFLPPEKEQTDLWTIAVLIIFSGLAVVLFSVTAYNNCKRRSKRNSYEEIENLVV